MFSNQTVCQIVARQAVHSTQKCEIIVNGNTNVFSGTDILSASGTNSGYKSYEGGWDFSGSLTTVIIEIGGRDINLSIGPLFDDVQVSVLYNVVNTIITQQISSVEMFIALNIDTPEDVIDVVEDIFDSNEMNQILKMIALTSISPAVGSINLLR